MPLKVGALFADALRITRPVAPSTQTGSIRIFR